MKCTVKENEDEVLWKWNRKKRIAEKSQRGPNYTEIPWTKISLSIEWGQRYPNILTKFCIISVNNLIFYCYYLILHVFSSKLWLLKKINGKLVTANTNLPSLETWLTNKLWKLTRNINKFDRPSTPPQNLQHDIEEGKKKKRECSVKHLNWK